MAGTIPSSTAWLARSWLVHWVMCEPLATGSKQSNQPLVDLFDDNMLGRVRRQRDQGWLWLAERVTA